MRILFYLPVVTPWWFNHIVTPMLRSLHDEAELHVMIAPLWRNTGIEADHLLPVADLERIRWHIIDDDDPALFRIDGAAVPGLMDLVQEIAPDLTIARSADQTTPALFPGTVRFIMEGAAPPFNTDPRWVIFEERLFAHGALPAGAENIGALCADALNDLWRLAEAHLSLEPPLGWRDHFGLPRHRPILAVPLQYEHEENFFLAHNAIPYANDLIPHLLETLDNEVFLAVTDHPLNRIHVDRQPLARLLAAYPERIRLCTADAMPYGATGLFAARADAMLIDQSKSWSLAAFSRTPILRLGVSPMADWIAASENLAGFPKGLMQPDPAAMRSWFGWHLGMRMFDPTQFSLDELMARIAGTVDENMINANLQSLLGRVRKEAA